MMIYGVICWYQWSTTPYSIINPINWYHMYSILISYLHSSYSSNRICWLIIQISLVSNSWDHKSEWYISILWCLFVFMVDEVNRWDESSYMNKNSKTMFNRWYCMINYNIQYQKSDYSSLEIDMISNNGEKSMNEILDLILIAKWWYLNKLHMMM